MHCLNLTNTEYLFRFLNRFTRFQNQKLFWNLHEKVDSLQNQDYTNLTFLCYNKTWIFLTRHPIHHFIFVSFCRFHQPHSKRTAVVVGKDQGVLEKYNLELIYKTFARKLTYGGEFIL